MFLVSNPKLIQMIEENRKNSETPEQYLLRVLKRAESIETSLGELTQKVDELWPTP
jgi:hypothetical protein